MGTSRWSSNTYATYASSVAHTSRDVLFSSRNIDDRFNPKKITLRESRDSEANPESIPIIVGFDVTGSMGIIPEYIVKNSLGTLFDKLGDSSLKDPHIMFTAIGDVVCDTAPLQVTQFEADNVITEQLTSLWIESGGGGNDFESYDLPWAFALNKVESDAWVKREKKGYIITIGDEQFPKKGDYSMISSDLSNETPDSILKSVQEKYNVFHIIIKEGRYCLSTDRYNRVVGSWRERLGKRAIVLNDYTKLSELIVSTILLDQGEDVESVLRNYSKDTQSVLKEAFLAED